MKIKFSAFSYIKCNLYNHLIQTITNEFLQNNKIFET